MDPVILKLVQLIFVSLIGAVAIIFGFILFIRGASGKSTILVERKDMKGKITNASPGVFLTIAGVLVLYWSVNKEIEKTDKTTETTITASTALDQWLANTSTIEIGTDYSDMITRLVGNSHFIAKYLTFPHNVTLGSIADSVYASSRYWKIIAVINKDRGYYRLDSADENTVVTSNNLIEYFDPAKFQHFKSRETLLKIRGNDMKEVYKVLVEYADTSKNVLGLDNLKKMEAFIKNNYEVSIGYKMETIDEDYTLYELSMKYYDGRQFYKVITGFNPALSRNIDPAKPLKKGTELYVPYVLP